MKRSPNNMIRYLTLLFLLSVLGASCGKASPGGTDEPAISTAAAPPPSDAEEKAAISKIAEYTSKSVALDDTLHELGYTPTVDANTWQQFSAIRKIETAYRAAEIAAPGQGGSTLLARLSRNLAQKYDGMKSEAAIAPYLVRAVTKGPIRFAKIPATDALAPLPKSIRDAITVLADYTSRGPVGTQREILTRYGGVSDAEAYDLLATRTFKDALHHAVARKTPSEREETVRMMAIAAATHYGAPQYEAALKPFLSGWSPPPAAPPPPPPPPDPPPYDPPPRPSPMWQAAGTVSCTCVEVRNGVKVREYTISKGMLCGYQRCE
jgi:hypothetical protein